jgi:hypothetical protein
MAHASDHSTPLPLDQLEAALEESCGALMTLQQVGAQLAAQAQAGQPAPELGEQVAQAAAGVRNAIAALREARTDGACRLGLGFVMERDGNGEGSTSYSSSPWRTA